MPSDRISRPRRAKRKTVHVVSLGCSKAQVDAEAALGALVRQGWRLVDTPEGADMVVVNTCGFIQPAIEESIEAIVGLEDLRAKGSVGELVVAGCLVDRFGDQLGAELTGVDRFVGSGAFRKWAQSRGRARIVAGRGPALPRKDDPRVLLNAPHHAYVKIAEGCDRACAFCTIPAIRGRQVSRNSTDILAEMRDLTARGVREAALVSQDTVRWGLDLAPRGRLGDLLAEIDDADGLMPWVRVHYLYPEPLPDTVVARLGRGRRVVPYVDLPIQHASDHVLKVMRRAHRRADVVALIDRLRAENPDVTLRTTLIVGHPGETPADVDILCDFLAAVRFDTVGIFTYWDEKGTAAASRSDKVDVQEQHLRAERVEEAAREASAEAARRWVGRTLRVLVDGRDPHNGDWVGRHAGQALDVDGLVRLTGYSGPAGVFVSARIEAADGYELEATAQGVATLPKIL